MTPPLATTVEPWTVNGFLLNTIAYNIETLSGTDDMPPVRGSNWQAPYRRGQRHRAKNFDQKIMTMAMWVRDVDPANGQAAATELLRKARMNDNLDQLKAVFGDLGGTSDVAPLTVIRGYAQLDGSVQFRTAHGELQKMVSAYDSDFGREIAKLTVDLLMPDPLWYAASTSASVNVGNSVNVTNPGTTFTDSHTIVFTGPLTNPKLTNSTPNPDVFVQYGGVILTGKSVTLDTAEFTAFDSDGNNVIGGITHSGFRHWMALEPGVNNLALTASAGTGKATVTFLPPYF